MYVPDLERSDAGTFTCVADNKIGNPDTASVTLAVACKSVCMPACLNFFRKKKKYELCLTEKGLIMNKRL